MMLSRQILRPWFLPALAVVLLAGWSIGRLGLVHCHRADGTVVLEQGVGDGCLPCGDHDHDLDADDHGDDPDCGEGCRVGDDCDDAVLIADAEGLPGGLQLPVARPPLAVPAWRLPRVLQVATGHRSMATWRSPPSQGPPARRGVVLLI